MFDSANFDNLEENQQAVEMDVKDDQLFQNTNLKLKVIQLCGVRCQAQLKRSN